jgi:protein gp37
MADRSGIAWTNATWNPVRGCTRVSEGCRNCYAEVLAARHSYEGGWGHEVAHYVGGQPRWTGVIEVPNHAMKIPLKWREPRRVFVNSMSDLFHEKVPFNVVDQVFDVMARCPQHTFQILTKRAQRMLEYSRRIIGEPLKNVWLGVSAEDQATFDERVPLLGHVPAAASTPDLRSRTSSGTVFPAGTRARCTGSSSAERADPTFGRWTSTARAA